MSGGPSAQSYVQFGGRLWGPGGLRNKHKKVTLTYERSTPAVGGLQFTDEMYTDDEGWFMFTHGLGTQFGTQCNGNKTKEARGWTYTYEELDYAISAEGYLEQTKVLEEGTYIWVCTSNLTPQ